MLKLPLLVTLCVILSTTSALSHKDSPHHSRTDDRDYSTVGSGPSTRKWHQPELRADYWTRMAKDIVKHQKDTENKRKAKNVIMFLGDGMGIQTVTAARMLLGDENQQLAFEKFRHSGLSKTYCVTSQIADSACTATAYLTGVKTNDGMVGINAKVPYGDCEGTNDESSYTYSIARWAQVAGKSTGLVTTTRVTHASPAGVYTHSAHRDWESDFSVSAQCDPSKVKDIAQQLVRGGVGSNLNVILGGGRREFMNNTVRDAQGVQGLRRDGRDLLSEWLNDGKRRKQLVKTRAQLQAVDTSRTDYLMGLFAGSDLKYYLEGDKTQPTLWEMTKKALEVLRKNKSGFFLFVEGGRIDHGHHENQAKLALTEAVQFSEAIEKTREMFSEKDTLIVTTADHSHVMSISGYPTRGNDILGVSTSGNLKDGLPYFTLNYANGPSFKDHVVQGRGRKDPKVVSRTGAYINQPAMVPVDYESHGGEDVPVYASGPWSHLFTGTFEQNAIPHFMAYAACIGNGKTMCN